MPIKIACQCGQQLTAKDELAGKRVKCPKCGGPLDVPSPAGKPGAAKAISDLLDDAGMRAGINRCPGCGAEMSEEAVLCVMCGFDMRKGHRIKARVGSASELDDEDLGELPVHGVEQLDRAERDIALDKLEQSRLGAGVPWWMILLAFLGVIGFTIGMVAMPQDQVVQNSGYILQGAGALMAVFFTIRILVVAFYESPLQGVLQFVPLYILYYVITRWDRTGPFFIFSIVGSVLAGVGYAMVAYLVPFFEGLGKEEPDYGMRSWQQRPVVVRVLRDINQA